MEPFEKILNYTFKNKELLETALTHSSYANEQRGGAVCNERLEFLGDSVLSIIVSDYLYNNFSLPEGRLTKLRASLVCEKTLCRFSRSLQVGQFLKLGRGERATGGADRDSLLADAFEAMRFVLEELRHMEHENFKDYKTELQEVIQRNPEENLHYVLTGQSGPDHNKQFTVEVRLNSNVIGVGTGHSKKAAEQAAACKALELMGIRI